MIRVLLILLSLTILMYGGVSVWYERVEQRLIALIPQQSEVLKPAVEEKNAIAGHAPLAGDYEVIIRRNIFEALLEASNNNPVVLEDVNHEETSLKLVLLGTIVGDEIDARAIIIDEQEKKQDLFRIGDSVQNARIQKIFRGKVILDVNGRTEALTLKERKGGGTPSSVANTTGRAMNQNISSAAVQKRVPVVRPRRRISFRESRPQVSEAVEEPLGPLEDEEEILEQGVGEENGAPDEQFEQESGEEPEEGLEQQ